MYVYNNDPLINSSSLITVLIEDVNDNAPQFLQSEYIFEVFEDAPRRTVLGFVQATDLDQTSQGQLKYSIQGKDLSNGTVLLDFDLDREIRENVTLLVTVSDEGGLFSTASIVVIVKDVNDNIPQFSLPFLRFTFDENSISGSDFGFINISDADINTAAFRIFSDYLTLTPLSSEDSLPEQYSIALTKPLSLNKTADCSSIENRIKFEEWLNVTDSGVPSNTNSIHVQLFVTDINDNPPIINLDPFNPSVTRIRLEIEENLAIRTMIYTFNITDDDPCSIASDISLEMTISNFSDLFSTQGHSLFINDVIDFETIEVPSFDLEIRAIEGDQRSEPVLVYIVMLNIDDEALQFKEINILNQIQENLELQAIIGSFICQDPDVIDTSGGYEINIDCTNTLLELVPDRRDSWNIIVKENIDYEEVKEIECSINGIDLNADPDYPNQDKRFDFMIEILNENDHVPQFHEPSFEFKISESMPPDSIIGTVSAFDIDNDLFYYFILSKYIYINSITGQVFLKIKLDYETGFQIS